MEYTGWITMGLGHGLGPKNLRRGSGALAFDGYHGVSSCLDGSTPKQQRWLSRYRIFSISTYYHFSISLPRMTIRYYRPSATALARSMYGLADLLVFQGHYNLLSLRSTDVDRSWREPPFTFLSTTTTLLLCQHPRWKPLSSLWHDAAQTSAFA